MNNSKSEPKGQTPKTDTQLLATLRTLAVLDALRLRGGGVTAETIQECVEAVDELQECWQAWERSFHGGDPVSEEEAAFLALAADHLTPTE